MKTAEHQASRIEKHLFHIGPRMFAISCPDPSGRKNTAFAKIGCLKEAALRTAYLYFAVPALARVNRRFSNRIVLSALGSFVNPKRQKVHCENIAGYHLFFDCDENPRPYHFGCCQKGPIFPISFRTVNNSVRYFSRWEK